MRNRNVEKSTGVIAITGTSRGIGKVVALELAQRGYQVACLSRGGHRPESADLDEDTRARLVPYVCDVLDEANVRAVFAEIPQRQGPLSVLINNAGFHVAADSHTFPTAEWERVMATNVTAVFQVSREAYPHLVANGGGTIINMGSFFDKLGTPQHGVQRIQSGRGGHHALSGSGMGAPGNPGLQCGAGLRGDGFEPGVSQPALGEEVPEPAHSHRPAGDAGGGGPLHRPADLGGVAVPDRGNALHRRWPGHVSLIVPPGTTSDVMAGSHPLFPRIP